MNAYLDKLIRRQRQVGSCLCVGLDPRPERHGGDPEAFVRRVIEETAPFAAAFKPNAAYFEALGSNGVRLLEQLRGWISDEIPLVLDVKRGDIGATQEYYAHACFERCGADAVTLNPYMGRDSIEPFWRHEGRGVYLLGVTSNPGAADIQKQSLGDGRKVFELVAEMASGHEGTGLVVGLTQASEPDLWQRLPDVPLLVPGFGAQGGDLDGLQARQGDAPVLVNVSRGILYPSTDQSFHHLARHHARLLSGLVPTA